jgi:DNA-binding NtrC family response regulator
MVRSLRVLVADDDERVRSAIIETLEGFGIHAVGVVSGRVAVRLCAGSCPFDVILADVVMGDIGGVQLAEMMNELHPHVPVVLMTGRDSQVENVVDAGAVALFKPFSALLLKRVIDEALEGRG